MCSHLTIICSMAVVSRPLVFRSLDCPTATGDYVHEWLPDWVLQRKRQGTVGRCQGAPTDLVRLCSSVAKQDLRQGTALVTVAISRQSLGLVSLVTRFSVEHQHRLSRSGCLTEQWPPSWPRSEGRKNRAPVFPSVHACSITVVSRVSAHLHVNTHPLIFDDTMVWSLYMQMAPPCKCPPLIFGP